MSIILAILGLGFLVFIHELGHYFVAKKVGMKVEAFSIGFGKALLKWNRNGVEWRVGILPFGGYVKIAGMQKEGNKEPHEIEGGFFNKKPWDRIKVAFMGPLVNIVFAFCAFTLLWSLGGRIKPFQQFTQRVGWVAPKSQLYEDGLRPGDSIRSINDKGYQGYQDLLYALIIKSADVPLVKGYKMDYQIHRKIPFSYQAPVGEINQEGQPVPFVSPAQYLLYANSQYLQNLPLEKSGIKPNDRLFWVNGEYVFSQNQLSHLLNEEAAFLTVDREGKIFHSKIPLAKVEDFRLHAAQRGELDDWKHEANLSASLKELSFLPYLVEPDNTVIRRIDFIDSLDQKRAFLICQRCAYFHPLQPGDKIIAINGQRVQSSFDLLRSLQNRKPLIIVERASQATTPISWKQADKEFDRLIESNAVAPIIAGIGTLEPISTSKNFVLLSSFEPLQAQKMVQDSSLYFSKEFPKEAKEKVLQDLSQTPNRFLLGSLFEDRKVEYNPNPFQLSWMVVKDVGKTLSALVQGHLNAKYLAGPVGILHMVQQSWLIGVKEALFWLGLISLNLALLNLLPIPILDGGHIVFSLFEMVTKKRLSAKTMERLTIPFFIVVIGFFAYVTYHDIFRLISNLFT